MNFFKHHALKTILPIVLAVAVIGGLAAGSYYAGYARGIENPKTVIVKGIANIGDDDVTADFSVFWEALEKLKESHIKGNTVNDQEFVYSAIDGISGAFDDENTIFLRPDDSKKFEEDIRGSFGGIGAEIGLKEKQVIIVAPLKKSPAEQAGLQPQDKILEIDGIPTDGFTVEDAVKRIRGEIRTTVVLTILRAAWTEAREISIVRQEIVVPTLDLVIDEEGIAHLKLHSFNENAPGAFLEAAVDIISNNAKGIVLDLRNNPGGFLEVSIDIAGWFLDRGTIVTTESFRDPAKDRVFRTRGNGALKKFPVVILVNEGSASASEILAGSLRDHRKASLIGTKTFGKGTVQELQPLHDGSRLKITVANWLLPSGQVLEKNGLAPDYEVKITEEDIETKRDPQFEKAKEVLKGEIVKLATSD